MRNKSNTFFSIIALLLISYFVSCDLRKPNQSPEAEAVDDLFQSASEIRLQMPESLSVNQLNIMRIDHNGFLYVALVPEYYLGVFDTEGKFIKMIGAQGFGPGELIRIQDFRIDLEGRIFLMDAITERISIFDSSGIYLWGFSPL